MNLPERRTYTLACGDGLVCHGNRRVTRTTNLRAAEANGDYGAIARGYGFLDEHCPHCTRDHAGMTCHWETRNA